MAMAVNHFIHGGWFSFLRRVQMQDEGFDEDEILGSGETADVKIEAAAKRLRQADREAEHMLLRGSYLYAEFGAQGCKFIFPLPKIKIV